MTLDSNPGSPAPEPCLSPRPGTAPDRGPLSQGRGRQSLGDPGSDPNLLSVATGQRERLHVDARVRRFSGRNRELGSDGTLFLPKYCLPLWNAHSQRARCSNREKDPPVLSLLSVPVLPIVASGLQPHACVRRFLPF